MAHGGTARVDAASVHCLNRAGAAWFVNVSGSTWPQLRKLSGYRFMSFRTPTSEYAVHWALPARPRLVVIRMTPFAAWVPYSVPAEGPFTISMLAMSFGSMSSIRDRVWPPVPTDSE